MRGFTKKDPAVLARERELRREAAEAKGRAIVEASNAALAARLEQMRQVREREKQARAARVKLHRARRLVERLQRQWGASCQGALA